MNKHTTGLMTLLPSKFGSDTFFQIEVEGVVSDPAIWEGLAKVTLPDGRQFIGVTSYNGQLKEGIYQVLDTVETIFKDKSAEKDE